MTINKKLIFYYCMKYPLPEKSDFFELDYNIVGIKNINETIELPVKNNDLIKQYTDQINENMKIFRSIPFLESLYLCNSISFGAINEQSDIDLLMITKPGRIRTCRFFSILFLGLFGLKRIGNFKKRKYCLSIMLSADNQNLYSIFKGPTDYYLIYRIAHLVKIYERQTIEDKNDIRENNNRISNFLPNFPMRQSIDLGVETNRGNGVLKHSIEIKLKHKLGDYLEKIIKNIRQLIMVIRKYIYKTTNKEIIANDKIMYFFNDRRDEYNSKIEKKLV